jgi:hypothetical protein
MNLFDKKRLRDRDIFSVLTTSVSANAGGTLQSQVLIFTAWGRPQTMPPVLKPPVIATVDALRVKTEWRACQGKWHLGGLAL